MSGIYRFRSIVLGVVLVLLLIIWLVSADAADASSAPDTTSLWAALAVAVTTTVVAPMLTTWQASRTRRAERLDDYARQDMVAEKAERVADLLMQRQNAAAAEASHVAQRLLVTNEIVAKTSKETIEKLDIIHTLVNSNMTAAMQSEFDATSRELAMMMEVLELKRAAGHQPSPASLGAIEAAKSNLDELGAALRDRKRNQDQINIHTSQETPREK